MSELAIEPDGEADHAPCSDCGRSTRSVWGYVSNEDGARAVYFIRWTDGHRERGAQLILSIGAWGEGSHPRDRSAFGFECRVDVSPSFMLVDADGLPWGSEELLGTKLTRDDALAHPLKAEVFDILDALVAQERRFHAFVDGSETR
jgi:hypothetical protein